MIDTNLSKYIVEKVKVLTTKGEDLNAQTTITKLSEAEYTVDAIVPDDGNDGRRFKVEFVPCGYHAHFGNSFVNRFYRLFYSQNVYH